MKKEKEFEVTWTERVTNNCFVIIKAKNAEEVLEKFENGEFDDFDRDEASNRFEDDVEVKEINNV